MLLGGGHHLDGDELEAALLEAGDDVANEAALVHMSAERQQVEEGG